MKGFSSYYVAIIGSPTRYPFVIFWLKRKYCIVRLKFPFSMTNLASILLQKCTGMSRNGFFPPAVFRPLSGGAGPFRAHNLLLLQISTLFAQTRARVPTFCLKPFFLSRRQLIKAWKALISVTFYAKGKRSVNLQKAKKRYTKPKGKETQKVSKFGKVNNGFMKYLFTPSTFALAPLFAAHFLFVVFGWHHLKHTWLVDQAP